jgi:GT2 family glycosyltransferase
MMRPDKIALVVVTFNRLGLLKKCVDSVNQQLDEIDTIFIVDNCSSDGTQVWLSSEHLSPKYTLSFQNENSGGAGGFCKGIELAIAAGMDWIWLMDDDASPHPGALHELMKIATNRENIYGSLAVNETSTAWDVTVLGEGGRMVYRAAADVPVCARVESLPFLGFMIHRELIERIGLPDREFFIAADDIEYCLRARRAGAEIIIAGKSRIEHPKTRTHVFNIMGVRIAYLALAPWKRYYDTRNRLLIARKYYGAALFYKTIPGSLFRLVAALLKEPDKRAQLKAFSAGFIDGLRGCKGQLHKKWGID